MARTGIIDVIKKDYSGAFPTLETSLAKNGMTQFPGTGKRFTPSKKADNTYRTGLDADKIKSLKEMLGEDVDLSPRSKFWNTAITPVEGALHASPVKLLDGKNFFNLETPMEAITYYWLTAHPMIARSLEAYERGEYPADTQFYVADEEYDNELRYKKAKILNDAIIKFDSFSLEKRKKIVRLIGIPVSDDTKEAAVYTQFDNFIKAATVSEGPYKGQTPVLVFDLFSNSNDEVIDVKDFVEKVLNNQVYRVGKGGGIFEGEEKLYNSKEELIDFLLNDNNQDTRLMLEKKLKAKLISKV